MGKDALLIELSSRVLCTLITTQNLQISNKDNVEWLTESALCLAKNMVEVFDDNGIDYNSYGDNK